MSQEADATVPLPFGEPALVAGGQHLEKSQIRSVSAKPVVMKARIRHLFVSPGHNYFGHHGQTPGAHPVVAVDSLRCIAGRGVEGDRFFDYKKNYKGQLTLFSWETFLALRDAVHAASADIAHLRRNVVVEGIDLTSLIGRTFELQGVRLEGTEECRPCYWMDQAIAPGAEAWLKGRGGLRCRILSDGALQKT